MQIPSFAFAAFASFALAARAAEPGHATLIPHQGESRDAPGNTLASFGLAVERGFGFECDVGVSSDGVLFTFHDDTPRRITDGADTRRLETVPWEEIGKMNVGVGRWKGTAFDGARPALLSDVLPLARDGRCIYFDVKPRPGIVPLIRDLFESQTVATPENSVFICFDEPTCAEFKRLMPAYRVYWISFARGRVGQLHKPPTPPISTEDILETLRRVGADGVDIQFDPDLHDEAFVRAIHDAGFSFHAWTVNEPDKIRLAFDRGVDTVTTDVAHATLSALAPEAR